MRKKTLHIILLVVAVFVILFIYLSMNLKSRNHGYEIQRLTTVKNELRSQIDKLLVQRERLTNLERVERIVTGTMNYRVPSVEQVIKVTIDED